MGNKSSPISYLIYSLYIFKFKIMTMTSQQKLNPIEKGKQNKHPLAIKQELEQLASAGLDAMDEFDRNHSLKWLGVFYRPVTPGKLMLRMRTPNGLLVSGQMRTLAEILQRYCQGVGFQEEGNADLTTRQNIQLRGMVIEDIPAIFEMLKKAGLTSTQSGMDNVRNITGSPVAGFDADELIDTRGLVLKLQDMITNNGEGNFELSNLPRKFNIAVAGGRDNSVHAEINDLAYVPAYRDGKLGFNVIVGGFFSAKRVAAAIPLNVWVDADGVVPLAEAILKVYSDNGYRGNRQKTRIMYYIEEIGLEAFRAQLEEFLGYQLETATEEDLIDWDKRDHIGVYKQKQPGLNYVGLCVPVGRLYASEMLELARLAEVYGNGEIRLTVEQNVIIPNIPDSRLQYFLEEVSCQERLSMNPNPLERALVSCTGAEFCNFAIVETKNRALAIVKELEAELDFPKPVRIHWTGCPNSCGQPQVADIGLMGTKARKDGNMVEAVNIYLGGTVGKDAKLGEEAMKSIPCEDLKAVMQEILIERFGGLAKTLMAV